MSNVFGHEQTTPSDTHTHVISNAHLAKIPFIEFSHYHDNDFPEFLAYVLS